MFKTRLRSAVYNSILETIGRTPVVRLNKLAPANVDVYCKLEYFNPLSSVKDRMAYAIIADAEKKGQLKPGDTVVEATSGNTGIALAMVCAAKGYRFVATMSETFSIERRKMMRALGAKVILTPGSLGGVGMVRKAEELADKHGWLLARQFENDANPAYHATTTAPEILDDFRNMGLDYYVTGYGTGGTFTGTCKVLKAAYPDLQVILAEPEAAQLVKSGEKQDRLPNGAPVGPHPAWKGPHPIQGWTPMFIPKIVEEGLDMNLADKIELISGPDAMSCAMELAQKEGIATGISGGGTCAVGLRIAASAPPGSKVLVMLADTMERYLSTALLNQIAADMDESERELMLSTPTAQMA
jgi:cysteine synthase A